MSRRVLLAGLLWALLPGCKDAGREQLQKTKDRHAELLFRGTPLSASEFDEVLRALDQVPEGSQARGEARTLAQAIRAARSPVERPLAVNPGSAEGADLQVTKAHCAELARALGATPDGTQRVRTHERLRECQRAVTALEELHHHHRQ